MLPCLQIDLLVDIHVDTCTHTIIHVHVPVDAQQNLVYGDREVHVRALLAFETKKLHFSPIYSCLPQLES